MCDEASDVESSEDEDGNKRRGHKNTENQYYDKKLLERKTHFEFKDYENKYERKARKEEIREQREAEAKRTGHQVEYSVSESEGTENEYDEDEDMTAKNKNLPSVNDAKLWQVKVKRNFERTACMALLNKCIDF